MIYKTREMAEAALTNLVFAGKIEFGDWYIQEIPGGYELLPTNIFEYVPEVE